MNSDNGPVVPTDVVGPVGGLPDEVRVTLAVYGAELMPAQVSALLGCEPTKSHIRGEAVKVGARPFDQGAWLLTRQLPEGQSLDQAMHDLFALVRGGSITIRQLVAHHSVRIVVAMHSDRWNSSFGLSPSVLSELVKSGAELTFDFYSYGENA